MVHPRRKVQSSPTATTLMPISVDVDLVRFEKNLLQIGFFGANDARDKNRTSRRIEQTVVRNGSKIKVAAEFRGSEALGLPSTTDRDKFIALLKIVSEERIKTGVIANPIRFSGYRLIKELGLSRNGEIYDEILRWGKRMTDTTITSEQVVYRAAKKVYSDEVLHVFRSFKRTGSSTLTGADRQEHYEVVLEDWLLENLNQRYVIPEDFNAYKLLTRPTAKGIFGNLHLWFHARQGRPVEKDYTDLCNLLNVQAYPHLSKIKSTMGLALDELVSIKYLSQWDVQKMSSKVGYKVVLMAGEELLAILDTARPSRHDALPVPSLEVQHPGPQEDHAAKLLKEHGILPSRARKLIREHGAQKVGETIEYLTSEVIQGGRTTVDNPAGLIIYSLENSLPIPARYAASKRKQTSEQSFAAAEKCDDTQAQHEAAYATWVDDQRDAAVRERYTPEELSLKLQSVAKALAAQDARIQRMTEQARRDVAFRVLRRELASTVVLPCIEDWLPTVEQTDLFDF